MKHTEDVDRKWNTKKQNKKITPVALNFIIMFILPVIECINILLMFLGASTSEVIGAHNKRFFMIMISNL